MRHESWPHSPLKGKTIKYENDSTYAHVRTRRFFGKEFHLKRGYGKIEDQIAKAEKVENEFKLLGEFGINVAPHSSVTMAIPDGNKEVPSLVTATKIINGGPLQEAPGRDRLDLYRALSEYYILKIGDKSPFLEHISDPNQYVYGSIGSEAPKIYLLYPSRDLMEGPEGRIRHALIDFTITYGFKKLEDVVRSA